MAFYRGETVICSTTLTYNRVPVNADSAPLITIKYQPTGEVIIDPAAMENDSTGHYHYNFQTSDAMVSGIYLARIAAIYSGNTSILQKAFQLDA